jgi:hypothetical protein
VFPSDARQILTVVYCKEWRKKKIFVVRLYLKRTAKIRYRAFCMTHGKEALCRAPDKRRTAKI